MARSPFIRHQHRVGITRRELLQVGYSGLLGVGLPSALAGRTLGSDADRGVQSLPAKPKQVLIIFLTGAASHHDTFDMKPDAPAEVRGEFSSIATSTPGLHISEHLPHLAKRADKYSIIRSLSHGDNNHLMSTHYVLTGELQPGGFFDKVASRDDWPSYAAACAYLRPRNDGIPSGVNLPTYLWSGALTWPGQHAGFIGPKYDPWQITGDPNKDNFRVDNLTLAAGLDVTRLDTRRSLVNAFNQQRDRLSNAAVAQRLTGEQDLAFSILTSSRFAEAFQLSRESDKVRESYGRHTTGQSLLLARRLIEAGVPVVQTNIGAVQTWDNHSAIFSTLKDRLLPPLDQGVATLLDDLESRNLLDGTLVMMLGEFGRTPKINNNQGRDHWGPCFFAMFAGGGVRGGQVIGRSDATGAYPVTKAYSPIDIGATVYQALGIPPNAEVRDRFDRPVRLNRGEVISPLYTGVEV
ncbi:MAG: DUF1501 domain-containing protein [Planctomycetaceae bacterium]|nr:DUF1501 domain-containing protein [Planctomycetales bacterium]MCB9925107.1 DUF1501 domain-containing protein [Planctomycetaceae bacterium]